MHVYFAFRDELMQARNDIALLTLEISEMKENFEIVLERATDDLRKVGS